MTTRDERIRKLLGKFHASEASTLDELMVEMYDDLTRICRSALRREGAVTWTTRDLAHEVWLAVPDRIPKTVEDRRAFLRYLGAVQRSVLVDYARRRKAARRGGGMRPLTIEGLQIPAAAVDDRLLDLDILLRDLESDPESSRLVELIQFRLFLGMTELETAKALGVSRSTVQRRWQRCKPLLHEVLDAPVQETEDADDEE